MIYTSVYLGANITKFVHTITVEAPSLRNVIKLVRFSSGIMGHVQLSSDSMELLFLNCVEIESILAETSETLNQLVWPCLLLEEVKLVKLRQARHVQGYVYDNYLYLLVQLKFRRSFNSVSINLISPYSDDKHSLNVAHLLTNRLRDFSSLEVLKIDQCRLPSCEGLDKVLNNCHSTTKWLEIQTLDSENWNDLLENIEPNKDIHYVRIEKFIIGNFSFQYLMRKFVGLKLLTFSVLNYGNEHEEQEEEYWNQLTQVFSFTLVARTRMGLSAFRLQSQVDSCIKLLLKFGCRKKVLNISFHSKKMKIGDDYVPGEPESVNIIKDKSKDIIEIYLAFPRIAENIMQVLKFLDSWLQLYCPRVINYSGIESITNIYKLFLAIPGEERRLEPYFDLKYTGDIKYFLSKHCNKTCWNFFYKATSYSDSCTLNGIVLCSLPRSAIPNKRRRGSIYALTIFASIIYHEMLLEISLRLPKIHKLTFHTCCILMDDPYVLKIFLPSTILRNLVLHVAPLLRETEIKNQDNLIEMSTLENLDLLAAVSSTGHYILKIETEVKTCIYKKQGNDSKKMDLKPEDVTCGTKDNFLI